MLIALRDLKWSQNQIREPQRNAKCPPSDMHIKTKLVSPQRNSKTERGWKCDADESKCVSVLLMRACGSLTSLSDTQGTLFMSGLRSLLFYNNFQDESEDPNWCERTTILHILGWDKAETDVFLRMASGCTLTHQPDAQINIHKSKTILSQQAEN